ncbi:nuclear transport factor 2-like [Rutidosis leptorrhynchoides]|uniref:nuclear transport factor 2-like n=1 Tax=Rutidosis leptorrhynchoides TaxID=125765 RepID=UPI003A98EC40
MADQAVPAAPAPAPVSAQVVGDAFVQQYYHILHKSPGLVHRFYQDTSKLGRPEEDGSMSITTSMEAINAKILSLNYVNSKAEIISVDALDSLNGGVNVLVTGYWTGHDNFAQNFTQSFFLAPQDRGYFVLNDIFRYIGDHVPTENVVAPVTSEQEPEIAPVERNYIPEQAVVSTEESQIEKVVPVENGEVTTVEDVDPVPEVVDDVQDSSQVAVETNTKIEDLPKKSYAYIVMDLKQNGVPFSSGAPAARKPQPRKQEQQLINAVKATTIVAETAAANVDAVENGIQEEESEGYSIYIKGLPMSATPAVLQEEFKKFGPIKPNGIQVRNNKGFCFGFVEFEVPEAVQNAIKASPVTIGDRNVVVEEKRSTYSRGGSRGRFVGGRGPGLMRNDSMRGGRGGYGGGRGYNRSSDIGGNRNDYGYRGSSSSRGGAAANRGGGGDEGYQRDNNGVRVNRGVDVNRAARNTPQ